MKIADEREAVARYGSSNSGTSSGGIFQAAMEKKEEDKYAFLKCELKGQSQSSSVFYCSLSSLARHPTKVGAPQITSTRLRDHDEALRDTKFQALSLNPEEYPS